MAIAQEDTEFQEREAKRQRRQAEENHRRQRVLNEAADISASTVIDRTDVQEDTHGANTSSSFDEDPDAEETSFSNYHLSSTKKHHTMPPKTSSRSDKQLTKRCLVDDPLFVASLDRTKTTPRAAMHVVAPALKAAGIDIDMMTLSTSTIYRSRKSVRKSLVETTKEQFVPNTPLVAHFDGKLLPENDGQSEELVDRMPIVVSGVNIEKLLAIPRLPTSTGEMMGKAVVQTLQDWKGVSDWLAGLCFDTTSSNTGIHTGAITVIQQMYDRRLLFLACRHHIFEIISTAVFDKFFKSSGPQIALFSRFKEHWKFIDVTQYSAIDAAVSAVKSDLTSAEKAWLCQTKADIINFRQNQISRETQPRQDYLEFINLSLIMLGSVDTRVGEDGSPLPIRFSPPGAYHRARWMAKGIYCLKIYLFCEQFKLTSQELQALRRICLFTLTIYVKVWQSAPSSCDAPLNDLCLLQSLESYAEVDSQVSEVALKKMRGHLWYLSEI